MGDEYVLKEFDRLSNNYCKSALGIIKDTIKRNPHTAQEALDKMKEHVNVAASKAIHGGTTGKSNTVLVIHQTSITLLNHPDTCL